MKRHLLAFVAVMALAGVSPVKAQTIVYDPTSYTKLVQEAETGLQQLQQLQQQVSNGQTLLTSLNASSGVNTLATVLSSPLVRTYLPDTSAYLAVGQGGGLSQIGSLSGSAQTIRNVNRLYKPQAGDAIAADIEVQGDRAARDLATGQAISTAAETRLTGLQQLQGSLSTAGDARAVMDLQARIQIEQAMIANDQMRLQGLSMAQAAEDKLKQQRDLERMEADRDARTALYKAAFQ